MKEEAPVLMRFLNNKDSVANENENIKSLNPAQVIAEDVSESTQLLCQLSDSRINTILNFANAFMMLWTASGIVNIVIMEISFALPYLPILCIVYALTYNYFSKILSEEFYIVNNIYSRIKDILYQRIAFVDTFAEPLKFKRMTINEYDFINAQLQVEEKIRQKAILQRANLRWFNAIHYKVRDIIPTTFAALDKLQSGEKIAVSDLFDLADYFSNLNDFFTWHNDNVDDMATIENAAQRIHALEALLNKCHELIRQSKITLSKKDPFFNGSIFNSEGKTLLKFHKVKLEKSQRYWFDVPSGSRKTTLFRVLSGTWPLGKGQFSCPQNTVFVPQTTVILPGDEPLIHSIVAQIKSYDASFQMTKDTVRSIQDRMREMDLSDDIISRLEERAWTVKGKFYKAEWSKTLSGGERAGVGLIALFFIKPEMIILDEPFAAIDSNTRENIQGCLRKNFPDVTLIFTHHGDLKTTNFFERKLVINRESCEVTVQLL